MDLKTILWTVVLGLLVVAIAAAGRRIRPSLLSTFDPAAATVSNIVYRMRRRLRGKPGRRPRNTVSLEERLEHLNDLRKVRFFILGAIYLDIAMSPITVSILRATEHSSLDRVQLKCGGAARFVGHYLNELYATRSALFSRIGSGDALSDQLKKILRREPWIRSRNIQVVDNAQSGISFHLSQNRERYHTTFTSRGTLADFGWHRVLRRLRTLRREAAYFTYQDISGPACPKSSANSLRDLSHHLIICVDHGRFDAVDNRQASDALLDAFSEKLVDIYICTLPELKTLVGVRSGRTDSDLSSTDYDAVAASDLDGDAAPGKTITVDADSSVDELQVVEQLAHFESLPRVTVVRLKPIGDRARASLIIDGEAHRIEPENTTIAARRNIVGSNNSFNAALIYKLCHASAPGPTLKDKFEPAVKEALRQWCLHA